MQERPQNNGTKGEHEEMIVMRSGRQSTATIEIAREKTENAEETTVTIATMTVEDIVTGIGSDKYRLDLWLR